MAAALLCFCVRFVLRELPVSRSRWLGPVGTVLGCILQALYMCWVYAAIAWFYRAVGEVGGLRRAYEDYIARRRKAGASPEQLKQLKLEKQKKLQKHKKKR